jgi:hypothetical protein
MADSTLYGNIANDYSDGNANDIQHVSQQGGKVRVISGLLTLASTDVDTQTDGSEDKHRICRLPSAARVHGIYFAHGGDLDTNGSAELSMNVGLQETDGTLLDEDCYADGLTQFQAPVTNMNTNVVGIITGGTNPNDFHKFAWERAGKTADDGKQMDLILVVKVDAATAGSGTVAFRVEYTLD